MLTAILSTITSAVWPGSALRRTRFRWFLRPCFWPWPIAPCSSRLKFGRGTLARDAPRSRDAMIPVLERPPKVTFSLTETCNLACRHCYADCNKTAKRREVSPAEWLQLIDYLAANGVIQTYIEGGEPLHRPDIF